MKKRIRIITSLKSTLNLPPSHSLTSNQWSSINTELHKLESRLISTLNNGLRPYLSKFGELEAERSINRVLGEVELELSRAMSFHDTLFDILTQRSVYGKVLAGCEVLAHDALAVDHPAMKVLDPPIVFFDRGAGASVLRVGIPLPYKVNVPISLIQIPHGKLRSPTDVTSLLHEAGHETNSRLGLDTAIRPIILQKLRNARADPITIDIFSSGLSEIIPDLCSTFKCGYAQASSQKDILSVPQELAFSISLTDPHPAPYLRVLLSLEHCRQLWGTGIWDQMKLEWKKYYTIDVLPTRIRKIMFDALKHIPLISTILLNSRLSTLNGKRIMDLFDLRDIHPELILERAKTVGTGKLNLRGISPCAQLAVFRAIRDFGILQEDAIDRVMTSWLLKLGESRQNNPIRLILKESSGLYK